jgi:glycosyltransferase involved in cell wall biosynthesis
MTKPFVSVLTPTYNRRRFIPYAIKCYEAQTYPKDRMEWIILDDGTDSVEDLFKDLKIPNIKYIRLNDKLLIGAKRNILHKESKGDILVSMDDDDYYHPDRVHHVVQKFGLNPSIQLAGSSEIYIYYSDNQKIYKFGPYGPNHCTNGTMAVRREYALTHLYDETVKNAEERSFLEAYKHPMIQLDPFKVMLVISHTENTYDKKKMRDQISPFVSMTNFKIKEFIRPSELRQFYAAA